MTEALRELSGAWNFRDVADGAPALRPGRLFRSGELSRLDDDGRATLRQLGHHRRRRPAREPRSRPARSGIGSRRHRDPPAALPRSRRMTRPTPTTQAPHETAFRAAVRPAGRRRIRRSDQRGRRPLHDRTNTAQFPTRNGAQQALHRVITLLAAGRPVLTHCFAGKDRTGFVVATVLETIGIDRDTIVADFLRSNDAVPQLRDHIYEMIQQRQTPNSPRRW